ncbi:MAG: hypothetical protein NT126_12705 [Bacteroidetes bacterium]|nr:hypothetical protein [Bacteroidota bacterium]
MKINLYNYNLPIVFSYCESVLKKMNYRVQYADFKTGIISASKGEGLSTLSSLMDLKFSADNYSVCIAVFSSTMSNIFGNIYSDPVSEHQFAENLFETLEAKKIGIPFQLSEENYIEALAS